MSRFLLTLIAMATLAATGRSQLSTASWRSPMACGANCVYLLLSAHGVPIDYETAMGEVDVTPRGSTLHDLATACSRLGLAVESVQTSPRYMATLALPIVVHLDHWTGSINRIGHFVLLLDYDEIVGTAEYLDPMSLLLRRVSIDVFRREWSGFALIPTVTSRSSLATSGWLLVSGFVCAMAWGGRRRSGFGRGAA